MKTVLVGSGAREHALAEALSRTSDIIATPGNPGIAAIAETTDLEPEKLDADLFVIGPEAPLVDGLADRLRAQGKTVFGPGAAGARLEGSKAWMKEVVAAAGIPTAAFATFLEAADAKAYLRTLPAPWVVKTDGLAAGKGVLVTQDLAAADRDIDDKLSGASFGDAGRTVVVEEAMYGPELSVLAVCDAERYVLLPAAQDFKRKFDNDEGPNTGGMGAYSPVPGIDVDDLAIGERFVAPALAALGERGIDYRGVLYVGLMLTDGGPRLVEFNVRFGDPECQVVVPGLAGDFTALLMSAASGAVDGTLVHAAPDAAVTVVVASDEPAGGVIAGTDEASALPGVTVYHARTAERAGALVTAGSGRVLSVTGRGRDVAEARTHAYAGAGMISFPGAHYRTDIAAHVKESR